MFKFILSESKKQILFYHLIIFKAKYFVIFTKCYIIYFFELLMQRVRDINQIKFE